MNSKSVCFRRSFENWYSDAKQYYRENGDLLVKRDYITPEGFRLGRWIERQRGKYNGKIVSGITQECIEMLESVGMVWKLETRTPFDDWILICEKYFGEFGNLLVPKNVFYENLPLGEWIIEQRKKYSNNLLSDEEIKSLQNVGMVWSISERRAWNEWYNDAKEYFIANGDLLVPLNYKTQNGYKLGVWIFSQRDKRKNNSAYPKYRIEMLDKLQMVWCLDSIREEKWYGMLSYITDYKEKNGKLPLWPKNIPAPDGRYMDVWLSTQRKRIKAKKLTKDQIEKLKQIGIE